MEEIFYKRLRSALSESGKKQKELAQHLQIKEATVSQYLSGKAFPTLSKFHKICKYLDVSADYLLGLSDY